MTTTDSSRLTLCLIGVALLALAGLSACGGDNISCGDNTVEENGRCVLAEGQAVACGDGTRVSTSGACIVNDTSCGPGTAYSQDQEKCVPADRACADGASFDPDSGTCVAASSCGENTTEQDGTCVVDTDALCGSQTGVTFNQDSGRCEVTSGKCGDGTTQSAESGNCVIAEDSCGDGLTINDQGDCVPTDQICGDNTTFKRLGGQPTCVPDATCQEGDVVLDTDNDPATPGICVSPAEQLAANADVTDNEIDDDSANNDPDSGTPQQVTAPSVGQTATYAGVIQSGDSQDIDAFTFMGSEGQWFNLAVQSTGIPQPWFEIDGPEGYHREAAYGLQGDPARTLALPYDGEYTVSIKPTAALNDRFDGPYAGEDWSYVASLEQIDAPARGDLNSVDLSTMEPTASADLGNSLSDSFFNLENSNDAALIDVSVNAVGSDVEATLSTWGGPSSPLISGIDINEGDSFTLPTLTSSGTAPILAADWITMLGSDRDVEVGISPIENSEDLGAISAGGSTTSSQTTVMPDSSYYYIAELQAGEVVEVEHTNNENASIDYTVSTQTGQTIASDTEVPVPANRAPADDYGSGYFYVAESGIHVIEVSPNQSGTSLTDLETTLDSHTPNDIGSVGRDSSVMSGTISSTIDSARSGFNVVEITSPVYTSVEASISGGATAHLGVFRPEADPTFTSPSGTADGTGTLSVSDVGAYQETIIRVGAESQINSYSINITTGTDTPEFEPNGEQDLASPLVLGTPVVDASVGGSDTTDWYTFDLSSSLGQYEILYAPFQTGAFDSDGNDCAFYDDQGEITDPISHGGWNGCMSFIDGPLPSGQYWHVIDVGYSSSESYGTTFERRPGIVDTEPNNSKGSANSLPYTEFANNGVDIYGDTGTDGDDWFKLTVSSGSAPSSFTIDTSEIGYDTFFSDADIELQDANGNVLDDGSIGDSLDSGSVGSGDAPFYIYVFGGGSYDSQYRIQHN